jgi:hypothetical protein
MRTCNIDKNTSNCNCTYEPCPRKGICCDCLRYHQKMDEIPACFFPDYIEKTYDRSIEKFIEYYSKKK